MKNRDNKEFAPGAIVHAYNRGNNKEKIFFDEQDYKAFLFRLGLAFGFTDKEMSKEKILSMPYSRIRIEGKKDIYNMHAFCLMPNHFHLLIEQIGDESISKLILKVCTSYVKYINKKYGRIGHLFQDQFKSVPIESNEQLMWTSAYIHMNPIKDKIVKNPKDYQWSSYSDYSNKRNLIIIHKDLIENLFGTKDFEKETKNIYQDVKGAL